MTLLRLSTSYFRSSLLALGWKGFTRSSSTQLQEHCRAFRSVSESQCPESGTAQTICKVKLSTLTLSPVFSAWRYISLACKRNGPGGQQAASNFFWLPWTGSQDQLRAKEGSTSPCFVSTRPRRHGRRSRKAKMEGGVAGVSEGSATDASSSRLDSDEEYASSGGLML